MTDNELLELLKEHDALSMRAIGCVTERFGVEDCKKIRLSMAHYLADVYDKVLEIYKEEPDLYKDYKDTWPQPEDLKNHNET